MAEAALSRGYKYLAICDHTQSLAVASGLSPEEIRKRKSGDGIKKERTPT